MLISARAICQMPDNDSGQSRKEDAGDMSADVGMHRQFTVVGAKLPVDQGAAD